MEKFYAVIGDPIAHSMSPVMHNDLFQYYEMDAHYLPLHIQSENLSDAIKGLRACGIAGFNVTVPHKETIMAYLDELDPLAEAIGAVNTVIHRDGKLIGYNTDGTGFLRGLKNHQPQFSESKILVVGAGGAAKAIVYALAQASVSHITIANRTVNRAAQLITDCPYDVDMRALTLDDAAHKLNEYDCIIQTTSIGMSPRMNEKPLNLNLMREDVFVSDIIYNPFETAFLAEAKAKGARVQNGLEMFVYQGALAFELWTSQMPDTERMRRNVEQQLGGNYVNR
ncbi:shikimate dehydrogenase [Cytobacillus sp. FSL R7-0696]|uniref:shikimate dehydrogenase n=1 Tax=Cytobacillus sp. FSL R7-0696 TaxID=2921691 RepID=UPI0030FC5025